MEYAIIAAGQGSRLAEEGYPELKPMVKIGGQTLIERLITVFKQNDAENIYILFNEDSATIKEFAGLIRADDTIHISFKSTESSLHSFYEVLRLHPRIVEVCLTTTDTIFREDDFQKYIQYFQRNKDLDALMAVTDFVDDESPLYVQFDKDNSITAFTDRQVGSHPYVSGGIYCLRNAALEMVRTSLEHGISRMRNYQRALLSAQLAVKAYMFSDIVDIDHVEDIEKARQLIQGAGALQ